MNFVGMSLSNGTVPRKSAGNKSALEQIAQPSDLAEQPAGAIQLKDGAQIVISPAAAQLLQSIAKHDRKSPQAIIESLISVRADAIADEAIAKGGAR